MFEPITYSLATKYSNDLITFFINNFNVVMPEIDFTTVFDFVESVAQGGASIDKDFAEGAAALEKLKKGPVKVKVAFNGLAVETIAFAQNFGDYCQNSDFAVYGGDLLFLSVVVWDDKIRFQCKEVQTQSYIPS